MRILVFGGSFDPPHLGHAALLRAAASRIRPDLVLIVPAYHAPLKGRPGASAKDRVAMVKLGIVAALPAALRKKTRLDLGEVRSSKKVYTVGTLLRLRKKFPGAEFHFVVGSDSARNFGRWKDVGRLKSLCRFWTARRPGASRGTPTFFGEVTGRMPDISSTEVRRRLGSGEPVAKLLAPPVERFIRKRGLYLTGLIEKLDRALNPERFHHTLCVAELAEALAVRWGLDAGKARQAGLLHDLGRQVPVPEMPAFARRRRIKVPALDGIEAHNPLLAHAHISERLARDLGCDDPEILSAVRKHTLGDGRMSRLDRVLFVADACSRDRAYAGVERLRRLAFKSLDRAFAAVVENKLGLVVADGLWLHPCAKRLWNSLKK